MSKDTLKPIIQEVEYGTIIVHLDKLMKDKNITNYVLNTHTNIRFQTIQSLRDNTATRIDFKVLAKLCYSLGCKVSDIIEYVPNKK